VFAGEPADRVDDRPSPAAAFTGEAVGGADQGPSSRSVGNRSVYSERSRNLASAFILFALLVAGAVAIYWVTVRPTHPPTPDTAARGAPTTAAEPASEAPANPPPGANTAIEPQSGTQQVPNAAPPRGPSDSSASAPTAGEPASTSSAQVPPATVPTPESAAAQAPSRTETSESVGSEVGKTTNAPPTGDTRRRAVAPQRTKEQAERDASETQRLIERELGGSQPPGSNNKPPGQ
jgi:hypothetical protein